jgi:DNA-binding NarL/FixJ family response regulator
MADALKTHAPSHSRDAETAEPLRVLLMTRQRLFRDALSEGLEQDGRSRVVATARDSQEMVAEAKHNRPQVAVISDDVGAEEWQQAIRNIIERFPACAVLMLSTREDEDTLVDATELGARGYITRGVLVRDLSDAIEQLASGRAAIPDALVRSLLDRLVQRRSIAKQEDELLAQLSAREREVLTLVAEGASSDAISKALMISRETARKHVQNILVKLGVRSRLEAVAHLAQHGPLALLRASD